jgi:hypothetical protein
MNTRINIIVSITLATLLVSCAGYKSSTKTAQSEPYVETVWAGKTAVIKLNEKGVTSVENWLKNGVPIAGANKKALVIHNVKRSDAAIYSAYISTKSATNFLSPATSLQVLDYTNNFVTVSATPVVSTGTINPCPGAYAGYVSYTKTIANGWGWQPTAGTNVHTACDNNRSDTKIQFTGKSGDTGCSNTCITVWGNPTFSTAYRFTIYFPNNVPTGSYTLTLDSFNP